MARHSLARPSIRVRQPLCATSLSARWRALVPQREPPNGPARLSRRRTHSPRPTLGSSRWPSSFACHPLRPKGLPGTRAQRRQRRPSERNLFSGPSGSRSAVVGPRSGHGRATKSRHPRSTGIDKSVLSIGEPRRYRDRAHLEFVASQPCLVPLHSDYDSLARSFGTVTGSG